MSGGVCTSNGPSLEKHSFTYASPRKLGDDISSHWEASESFGAVQCLVTVISMFYVLLLNATKNDSLFQCGFVVCGNQRHGRCCDVLMYACLVWFIKPCPAARFCLSGSTEGPLSRGCIVTTAHVINRGKQECFPGKNQG